jgi:hypothetical protein
MEGAPENFIVLDDYLIIYIRRGGISGEDWRASAKFIIPFSAINDILSDEYAIKYGERG